MILDLEIYAPNDFLLMGEVEFEIGTEDDSFDYSYGSINGVHEIKRPIIREWNLSKIKAYPNNGHEGEEIPLTKEHEILIASKIISQL